MHWGIRRFQNADGTYTALGKLRKKEGRRATDSSNGGSPKPEKAKRRGRADLSEKSDDELRSAISRMELEKRYRDLDKYLNPEKEHKVKELIKEAGRNALKAALEKHFKTMLGAGDNKDGKGKGKGKGGQQNNGRSELYEEQEARRVKAQIGLNRLNQELRAQEAQMREQREAERREREEQRRRERAVRSIESHRWMY
jgi:hypothetical protein